GAVAARSAARPNKTRSRRGGELKHQVAVALMRAHRGEGACGTGAAADLDRKLLDRFANQLAGIDPGDFADRADKPGKTKIRSGLVDAARHLVEYIGEVKFAFFRIELRRYLVGARPPRRGGPGGERIACHGEGHMPAFPASVPVAQPASS